MLDDAYSNIGRSMCDVGDVHDETMAEVIAKAKELHRISEELLELINSRK